MATSGSILVADVGNTATNFAIFKAIPRRAKPNPQKIWTISTAHLKTPTLFKSALDRYLPPSAREKKILIGISISSVVPGVNRTLANELARRSGHRPLIAGPRTLSSVKILYHHPAEVGADRLVNARAIRELTRQPAIVVDFGTATTFDCVDAHGAFIGGVIAPGPAISAEALYLRTAKLPKVYLNKPARLMGRSTLECIQSGLYHGYRGLVREIVARLKERMGPGVQVFSTGGQASWILKGLDIINENISHLTLMGLYHMWHDRRAHG